MNRTPPPIPASPPHRIKSEAGIKLPPHPLVVILAAENIGTYLSLVHPGGGRPCTYPL
jgi:hypothetical protein